MSFVSRALIVLACLAVVSGFAPVLTAAPADASVTVLCKGYDACKALGMRNGGYKAASGTMWWRMYAGHNCTNYVAYRMVKSGLPNVRPWTGSGNAMYWGESVPELTDSVPAVGAVAWWEANIRPVSGSSGHVAYVEQVISEDEIIVSQDSWGGDFSWARITRSGGGWPSGFIHFNDVPLTNIVAPEAIGTPKVGADLTASPGTWSTSGATYSYQWRANGLDIPDATAATLTLRRTHKDKRISVETTASKVGYPTTTAYSSETAPVAPGEIKNVSAPLLTGTATVDSPLTATSGEWTPAPTGVSYQWQADGAPVPGAREPTFTPGPDEVGKAVTVLVTASKAGYVDVPVTSAATAPVAPGTITLSGPASLTGTPRLGEALTIDTGTAAPSDTEVSVQWRRAGLPVAEASGTSYALGVPDLGSRIAARVTYTKPGYTTVVTALPATRRVKTVPVITAAADPGRGRLELAIRVAAPGVFPVAGTVQIRSRGEVLKELTLRQGAVTTTVRGLEAGRRTVRIAYLPSPTVARAAWVRDVRIS